MDESDRKRALTALDRAIRNIADARVAADDNSMKGPFMDAIKACYLACGTLTGRPATDTIALFKTQEWRSHWRLSPFMRRILDEKGRADEGR